MKSDFINTENPTRNPNRMKVLPENEIVDHFKNRKSKTSYKICALWGDKMRINSDWGFSLRFHIL